MSIPVQMDFMSLSGYGSSTESSSKITVRRDHHGCARTPLLIVEDIIASSHNSDGRSADTCRCFRQRRELLRLDAVGRPAVGDVLEAAPAVGDFLDLASVLVISVKVQDIVLEVFASAASSAPCGGPRHRATGAG